MSKFKCDDGDFDGIIPDKAILKDNGKSVRK